MRFWFEAHTHQFELRARIPRKGSCSVWFLVVSIILCLCDQNCMVSISFRTVLLKFLDFSQKLPGGSIPTARRHIRDDHCFCFGLNRLAAMNSCQAAWYCSHSFLMFWCYSYKCAYGFCNWCEWVLLDTLLVQNWLQIGVWQGLRDDSVWIDLGLLMRMKIEILLWIKLRVES